MGFVDKLDMVLFAARRVREAYNNPSNKVLSTEWNDSMWRFAGEDYHVIAVAGTNDPVDWIWNFVLASWDGVKLASYFSAKRIMEKVSRRSAPLLICGHSKSGPTAIYLAKKLKADHCFAFCPAPGFRKREQMDNVTMVIDPDDIVHKLGRINFKHPDCEVIELKNDHKGYDINDHNINSVITSIKDIKVQHHV